MFFLSKLFALSDTSLNSKQKLKEKIRLQRLYKYYSGKLEYLSNKKISPQLALITCQDTPINRNSFTGKSGTMNYIKSCKSFYKNKLKEVNSSIKKL